MTSGVRGRRSGKSDGCGCDDPLRREGVTSSPVETTVATWLLQGVSLRRRSIGARRTKRRIRVARFADVPAVYPRVARADDTKCLFAGISYKPSDGLEPSTPSLPLRFGSVTRVHARSLATQFLLQIGVFAAHAVRRKTSRVSFLMCPFCVRGVLTKETTDAGVDGPTDTCRQGDHCSGAAGGGGGASRCAICAASIRLDTSSLRRMCETWTLAVLTLMTSSAAISRFV